MVIHDFNKIKPFSSFLSGISGFTGIPLWTFYVNRGQGICSFGIDNKENSILEFCPAHQSYQAVSYNGFRTFIKGTRNNEEFYYEPFSEFTQKNLNESMDINHSRLDISSINNENGIEVNVSYFTMPNEGCAALVRRVSFKNIGSSPVSLEVIDGLPAILPYKAACSVYKVMGNTLKAWMDVFNLETQIPIYKVRYSTEDSAEVSEVTGGYFYMSFTDNTLVSPIVDSRTVFGGNYALTYPNEFIESSLSAVTGKKQITSNKVPCGFSGVEKSLGIGESFMLNTIVGFVPDDKNTEGLKKFVNEEFISKKQTEASQVVDELLLDIETKTSNKIFDEYIKQCYLDNLLRGGYPLILGDKIYYVYSRKHGDLERDYNFFSIAPEFYSQGNGNFRDVNQNRRSDIFFNPAIGDFNVKAFFNFIQADGYNPLSIQGTTFSLDVSKLGYEIDEKLIAFFEKPFTPGKLITFMIENSLYNDEIFKNVFVKAVQVFEADFGEGYWIDHFTYNMDLINSYSQIFPDKVHDMLFGKKDILFFDSYALVRPRSEKYVVSRGKVRQYNAVNHSEEKKEIIENRLKETRFGKFLHVNGELYKTTLFGKLMLLAATKFSLLDPMGMGIEMEANKPGWNDSLNGMPGLIGSGVSELIELKIILDYIVSVKAENNHKVQLPTELVDLIKNLYELDEKDDFVYWDKSAEYRESYREQINFGFSSREEEITVETAKMYMRKFLEKVNDGMKKCLDIGKGIYPTYFYYEVTDYELTLSGAVKVKSFKQNVLPYFLEGAARGLKIADKDFAAKLHDKVKNSNIFDKKLKMYKANESLADTTFEIGRGKAFTPGWLENESIFMHMEYKYLLSMLTSGLYDEFFSDMKNAMPPFMDQKIYGRSILENSSFIASSANPDESVHGNGFVARLSGSTAEMLSMWFKIFVGNNPFKYENGKLTLEFNPIIPNWMFDDENKVSFKFLGSCIVTYINPNRITTYNSKDYIKFIEITDNDGNKSKSERIIQEELAIKIRDGLVSKIDVYFEAV